MRKAPAEVGFSPERLDPIVNSMLGALESSLLDIAKLRPLVEHIAAKVAEDVVAAPGATREERDELHERLIAKLERYTKLLLNLVKAGDELARLRSFSAGGSDSRPDIDSLSEAELARIIVTAAKGLEPAKPAE